MRISEIETFLVGNPWKNWLFVKVTTDEGIHGIGEGSLGHLSKTVEAAIHEERHARGSRERRCLAISKIWQPQCIASAVPAMPAGGCSRWWQVAVPWGGNHG